MIYNSCTYNRYKVCTMYIICTYRIFHQEYKTCGAYIVCKGIFKKITANTNKFCVSIFQETV